MDLKALLALLLLLPPVAATPWQIDEMEATVAFSGAVEIVPTSDRYSVDWVEGGFYIMPQQTWLQSARIVSAYPETYSIEKDKYGNAYVNFRWDEPSEKTLPYEIVWEVDVHRFKYLLNASGSLDDEIPEEIEQYLRVDNLTNWTSYMKAKAEAIVAGSNSTLEAVRRLTDWVSLAIEYDRNYWDTSLPAGEVFCNRRGVCDEFTNLFIALCRSVGIPARYVEGLVYSGQEWNFHAFAEVYIGGWVPVDPTYNEVGFLDSSHIVLANVWSDNEVYNNVRWAGRDISLEFGGDRSTVNIIRSSSRKLLGLNVEVRDTAIGLELLNVKATLTNLATSKLVATCSLSMPAQMLLLDLEEKSILLQSGEKAELSWSITAPADLDKKWLHSMPIIVYCFPGINATKDVQIDPKSSKPPVAKAAIVDVTVLDADRAIVIVKNTGTKQLTPIVSLCISKTSKCFNQTISLLPAELTSVEFKGLAITEGTAVSAKLHSDGLDVQSNVITISDLSSKPPTNPPAEPPKVETKSAPLIDEGMITILAILVLTLVVVFVIVRVLRGG